MKAWASGENSTWPSEPAAVPIPSTRERRSAPTALAMAASAIEKAVKAMPRPVSSPANRWKAAPVSATAMPQIPSP